VSNRKAEDIVILTSFQEGQTALYKASYYGQSAVVDTLLSAKAQVDVGNKVTMNFWILYYTHINPVCSLLIHCLCVLWELSGYDWLCRLEGHLFSQ